LLKIDELEKEKKNFFDKYNVELFKNSENFKKNNKDYNFDDLSKYIEQIKDHKNQLIEKLQEIAGSEYNNDEFSDNANLSIFISKIDDYKSELSDLRLQNQKNNEKIMELEKELLKQKTINENFHNTNSKLTDEYNNISKVNEQLSLEKKFYFLKNKYLEITNAMYYYYYLIISISLNNIYNQRDNNNDEIDPFSILLTTKANNEKYLTEFEKLKISLIEAQKKIIQIDKSSNFNNPLYITERKYKNMLMKINEKNNELDAELKKIKIDRTHNPITYILSD
jgi:hypothetical protein